MIAGNLAVVLLLCGIILRNRQNTVGGNHVTHGVTALCHTVREQRGVILEGGLIVTGNLVTGQPAVPVEVLIHDLIQNGGHNVQRTLVKAVAVVILAILVTVDELHTGADIQTVHRVITADDTVGIQLVALVITVIHVRLLCCRSQLLDGPVAALNQRIEAVQTKIVRHGNVVEDHTGRSLVQNQKVGRRELNELTHRQLLDGFLDPPGLFEIDIRHDSQIQEIVLTHDTLRVKAELYQHLLLVAAGGDQVGNHRGDIDVRLIIVGQLNAVVLLQPAGTVKDCVLDDVTDRTGHALCRADLVPRVVGLMCTLVGPVHDVQSVVIVLDLNVGHDLRLGLLLGKLLLGILVTLYRILGVLGFFCTGKCTKAKNHRQHQQYQTNHLLLHK